MKTLIAMCLLAGVVLGMAGKVQAAEVDYEGTITAICKAHPSKDFCEDIVRTLSRYSAKTGKVVGMCTEMERMSNTGIPELKMTEKEKASCAANFERFNAIVKQ